MADQDLPELESTGSGRGKQVVFLFMSAVVVAVVIFLLGVSVGRGVRQPAAHVANAQVSGDSAPAVTPAAGQPAAPTDLKYHESLRGAPPADTTKSDAAVAPAPPAPPAAAGPPPAVSESTHASTASVPARNGAGGSASGATGTSASDSQRKSPTGAYSLQLGAFTTPAAARAMVSQVKAKDKSYPVTTLTLADAALKLRYRVMVGPYPTLDEANRVMGRLKKDGFDSYLKR
jgi:cell division septation protein DedD